MSNIISSVPHFTLEELTDSIHAIDNAIKNLQETREKLNTMRLEMKFESMKEEKSENLRVLTTFSDNNDTVDSMIMDTEVYDYE